MPYKDPEKKRQYHREYDRKWRAENRDKIGGYYRKYYYTHYEEIRQRKNQQNRKNEQKYEVRARRHHRHKIKALKLYGGDTPKCANCGEDRYECLQIDHVKNDGAYERRKISSGENFYYWLVKQSYQPHKYQVLCANCNAIKRIRVLESYNHGLKTIKEWEEWSKCKYIKTPEDVKKLWMKKRKQRY